MQKKNIIATYRIFFALLGLSAIVTEIATLVERGRFVPVNFFSFFTVEANLFAILIFILSAFAAAQGGKNKCLNMLRGANTFNMIVVGVVFSLLLSGIDADLTAVPWDNTVLHYIIPVAVAVDWLVNMPKARIVFRRALSWLIFPIIYLVYSLIRGHYVGWYPYPFLDPREHGYSGVALTSVMLVIGATGLIWLLTRLTHQAKS